MRIGRLEVQWLMQWRMTPPPSRQNLTEVVREREIKCTFSVFQGQARFRYIRGGGGKYGDRLRHRLPLYPARRRRLHGPLRSKDQEQAEQLPLCCLLLLLLLPLFVTLFPATVRLTYSSRWWWPANEKRQRFRSLDDVASETIPC